MAQLLWGKVYYKDTFAGYLREETGERFSFTYDLAYLSSGNPAIAYTLPLREAPYISQNLHPFFDNLVAEGWLENTQARLIGKRNWNRFELLLCFGADCAGAVSVIDPEPIALKEKSIALSDPKNLAILKGRASLSGVQPKCAIVKENKIFRPALAGELSTHIAKFPSPRFADIIENEWLSMLAYQTLLPNDEVAELTLTTIKGIDEEALVIKRFDRTPNKERIHFEEFNQLLNLSSAYKYDGSYVDMANFIYQCNQCIPIEVSRLFRRILAGILIGNTDMHFKNFAMIYTPTGLRLTPSYDQIAASIYQFQEMALKITRNSFDIGLLKGKHLFALGNEFQLNEDITGLLIKELGSRLELAKDTINEAKHGARFLKDDIIKEMDKRWKGTFSSIGKRLSKKR
ncbi:MAG: HipA domain-containing protein [Proteobacteria bacterium]|nr:HipA domain-containing protein [Pseudomonadota bacterium]